jgi:hypothetical protein
VKNLQMIGGISALLQGAALLLTLVLALVILPAQDIANPDDLANAAKVLPLTSNSFLPRLESLLNMSLATGTVLTVLALHERLPGGFRASLGIATASGLVATVLFLAGGIIDFLSLPRLARLYPDNQVAVGSAYLAERVVVDGVLVAAVFAYRWWVLVVSLTALQAEMLPKPLNYLGLALGAAVFLSFAAQPLAFVGTALAMAWTAWLGIVLLRDRASVPTT